MAFSASDVTNFKKHPIGNGDWFIRFTLTGPASYTSGGEALSRTVCRQAMEGISEIFSLPPSTGYLAADGSAAVMCAFEVLNDGTNVGKFHFYQGSDAHTHDFLLKGGQSAATHTHDFRVEGGQAALADQDDDRVGIYTDVIGKEAATDVVIAGADSATKGGVVAESVPTAILMVGTDTIGKEEATDRTIVGADSATKGGIVSGGATAISAPEVAAATDYSDYVVHFFGIGRL